MQGSNYHILPSKVIFRETFQDLISIGKNGGIISGSPLIQNGIATFSGNEYITYKINLTSGNSTYRAIIIPEIISTNTVILSSNNQNFLIGINNNAQVQGSTDYISLAMNLYVMSNQINYSLIKGKSYDFIVSIDFIGGHWYLYLNGNLIGNNTLNITSRKHIDTFNLFGGASFGKFNCIAKLVEVYNYALSAAEIADLYAQTLYNDPTR